MKKNIHPNYHMVTVVLNDGTSYRTRTTWGEPDQKLTLDESRVLLRFYKQLHAMQGSFAV